MKLNDLRIVACIAVSVFQCRSTLAANPKVDEPDAAGRSAWVKMSEIGNGFVVWESNRTGSWRIWRRELNGTGLRQISADENRRDHFCPHISPDGRRLVFLSYPAGVHTYESGSPKGAVQLYIMDVDGSNVRQVTDSARAYFEDRAAVWLSEHDLVYIDHGGTTRRLDVSTGKTSVMTKAAGQGNGWLINSKLAYATTGLPTFSNYNAVTSEIVLLNGQAGCQPYFTHDGEWGFWMGGGGGPINRINLKSRQITPILNSSDPRMPKDRNYLYFPMISRSGRLFTFAASPGQHDHFTSDYDVFVATINPRTLELTGDPVRYSFHPGNDRFPDVYLAEFELGRPFGEAPFTVELTPPSAKGSWHFDFGDGNKLDADKGKHTYRKAGRYAVVASQGNQTVRGTVTVEPAAPPKVLNARLVSPQEVRVEFDEPVEIRQLVARLGSGTGITESKLIDDRRTLVLALANRLAAADILQLSGVSDRAQLPNTLSAQSLPIRGATWPSNTQGLEFVYGTGGQPNLIPAREGHSSRGFGLQPRGRARWNHDQALVLNGGSFSVDGADEVLLAACRQSQQLTVEAVIRPDHLNQTGPARIVTFSSSASRRDFTLAQEGGTLVFRLRTPQTGENGVNPETRLGSVAADVQQHVVVTYRPGQMTAYIDGKEIYRGNSVTGDLSNWEPHHLVLGDEFDGSRNWSGTLEGIAVYSRVLEAGEIQQNAAEYQRTLKGRRPVRQAVVSAKLVAKSPVPTLDEVKPYRGALMVCKYDVQEVLQGQLAEKQVLVTQWALLDGQPLDISNRTPGTTVNLVLELSEDNPQLKRFVCKDRFDSDEELLLPRYYDATP